MSIIKAGAIAKGMFLLMKNEPHLVTDREFVNPGKGSAFVRLKMRSLVSGRGLQQVIKSQESVEEINVEHKDVQYLYADAENYHFMDLQSYEQFTMPLQGQEDKKLFMKDGDTVQLSFWDDRAMDILLPYKIVLTVTQAGVGLKGDTVSGATKPVTLETGLVVRVPLFIKEGDRLLINTETRDYVERAT